MAKEFDFKKAGKQQKAFKTPMLTSKTSPSQARMAGKQKQELARNPNGNQLLFDAGFGGVLSKAARLLTPKSVRVAKAVSRLYKASHAVDGSLGRDIYGIRKAIKAGEDAYGAAKSKAYRELGYRPGEAIDHSISGTDAYSGSSYRVGRGTPRIGMSRPVSSGAEYTARGLERRSGNALWKKGFSGIESELKTRLKTKRGK